MRDHETPLPDMTVISTNWTALPAGTDTGEGAVFAIGDIHGRHRALTRALREVADLAGDAPHDLVFLGDIIDRGEESLACLLDIERHRRGGCAARVTVLPGNHELMMLDCFHQRDDFGLWVENGGDRLLDNLAAAEGLPLHDALDIRAAMGVHIPDYWLAQKFPSHHRIGSLVFVHAGLSPKIPMETFVSTPAQNARLTHAHVQDHWAWIRNAFLNHDGDWPGAPQSLVVHGHTPAFRRFIDAPDTIARACLMPSGQKRICLDAGASVREQVLIAEFRANRARLHLVAEDPGWLP